MSSPLAGTRPTAAPPTNLHGWRHLQPAAIGNNAFTTNNAKFLPQPRIGWRGARAATKPSSAPASESTTSCRTPSAIAWIRTRPSIRPTVSLRCRSRASHRSLGAYPGECPPRARRRSTRPEDADPHLLFAARRAGTHPQHFVHRGLRWLPWLPRAHRRRRQPARTDHLPGIALPGGLSREFPSAPGRHRRPGRKLLHPRRNAQGQPNLANTWTWFSWATAITTRSRLMSITGLAMICVARRLYMVKGARQWRFTEPNNRWNAPGLVSNPYDLHADWGPATYDVRNIGVSVPFMICPLGGASPSLMISMAWPTASISGWSVEQHPHRCSRGSRIRRSSATTRPTMGTPVIR